MNTAKPTAAAMRAAEDILTHLNFDLEKCKDDWTPELAQIIDREFAGMVEATELFLNASEWPTPYKNKLQIQSGLKEAFAKLNAK